MNQIKSDFRNAQNLSGNKLLSISIEVNGQKKYREIHKISS